MNVFYSPQEVACGVFVRLRNILTFGTMWLYHLEALHLLFIFLAAFTACQDVQGNLQSADQERLFRTG